MRFLFLALSLSAALAACGTKGGLECPPGSIEREDGTCLPAPADTAPTAESQ